jgi:argininosuccinate synthase
VPCFPNKQTNKQTNKYKVHCFIFQANIGQEEDFEAARKKALTIGASKASDCCMFVTL